MAGLLNIIGVVAGVVGLVQLGENAFAPKSSVGSQVKIAVGLDYAGGLSGAGGDLPDVRLYSEAGNEIGITVDPGHIGDGGTGTITVNHKDDNSQQATYALFSANNDAICVAYTTITWPDGNQYAWTGDWGEQCGGAWYYSNVYIEGGDYKPNCLWIDGNGDEPQTGFQLHFPEFTSQTGDVPAKSTDYFCNSGPPFKLYTSNDPNGITYWVIQNGNTKRSYNLPPKYGRHPRRLSAGLSRRNGGNSTSPHLGKLVISNNTQHETNHLCQSKTSVGPDFVNLAGGDFCRMSDKTVWPICTSSTKDNCFNTNTHKLIVGGKTTRDTPYIDVADWTTGT